LANRDDQNVVGWMTASNADSGSANGNSTRPFPHGGVTPTPAIGLFGDMGGNCTPSMPERKETVVKRSWARNRRRIHYYDTGAGQKIAVAAGMTSRFAAPKVNARSSFSDFECTLCAQQAQRTHLLAPPDRSFG